MQDDSKGSPRLAVDEQQKLVVFSHRLWSDQILNISQSQMRNYRKLLQRGKDSARVRIVFRDKLHWIIFPKENFVEQQPPTAVELQIGSQPKSVESSLEDGSLRDGGNIKQEQPFDARSILLPNVSSFNSSSKIGELVKPEYLASLGLPQSIAARRISTQKSSIFGILRPQQKKFPCSQTS